MNNFDNLDHVCGECGSYVHMAFLGGHYVEAFPCEHCRNAARTIAKQEAEESIKNQMAIVGRYLAKWSITYVPEDGLHICEGCGHYDVDWLEIDHDPMCAVKQHMDMCGDLKLAGGE